MLGEITGALQLLKRQKLMNLISRDKIKTELGKQLYDRLKNEVWNDEGFLVGIFVRLKGDEKKRELIKYLDEGVTDSDGITDKSLEIAYGK